MRETALDYSQYENRILDATAYQDKLFLVHYERVSVWDFSDPLNLRHLEDLNITVSGRSRRGGAQWWIAREERHSGGVHVLNLDDGSVERLCTSPTSAVYSQGRRSAVCVYHGAHARVPPELG